MHESCYMGPCIDPAIMLSIYHVQVAIMLSYGNRVVWISISFLFTQIIFLKKLIYNYIYTQIYSLVSHTRIKDRERRTKIMKS